MLGGARKFDHLADGLAALPFVNELDGATDTSKERRWPHGAPDLDASANVSEVKQPVLKLDARNVVTHKDGPAAKLLHSHTRNPRCSNTEPGENDAEFMNGEYPFATNCSPIRPTVEIVSVRDGDHANDNFPPEDAA